MVNFLGGIFYFCIALGVLVTIHELGHFIAARACGVRVLRFSVGFGPVVFKKLGRNGCEYALSAIPLGGYVKMEGENNPVQGDKLMPDALAALPPDSFKAKSVGKRALIIFAGPFFNIALAVILFTFVNMGGIVERFAVVGDVVPHSAADNSGFKVYDRIEYADGKEVRTWSDFIYTLVENVGTNRNLAVVVKSDLGEGPSRTLNLPLSGFKLNRDEMPLDSLGLKMCFGKITTTIGMVQDNSPASRAGLQPHDKIVQINGVDVDNWYRLQEQILLSSENMELVILREGQKYSALVTPVFKERGKNGVKYPFIGIGASVEKLEGLSREVEYGPYDAFVKAIGDSLTMSKLVVVSAYKLVTGRISADNISGPISIARGAQESAHFGLSIFISFLAAISVNLGILNLIPIPVLDGGQLVFLAY